MTPCWPLFPKNKTQTSPRRLNILLTNGRFPVTLDLARQLHSAGHRVVVVDSMRFHICKFSIAVKRSYYSPAPSLNAEGYIKTVKEAIQKSNIDLIIPVHEEIFYLAQCGDMEILSRLFAPKFDLLYRLHNKWTFTGLLRELGLDVPEAYLCTSIDDVRDLDQTKSWAVKPILGRASTGVHHLRANRTDSDLPSIDISDEKPHIAQEWLKGERYCTYGVFREGKMQVLGIYPVLETIDGSSSVYFESVDHDEIRAYVLRIAEALQVTGQLAFDFIETGTGGRESPRSPQSSQSMAGSAHRLVAIECNPRATSGIHLWSGTPHLANVLTSGIPSPYAPAVNLMDGDSQPAPPKELRAQPGCKRQVGPGMLMWEHKNANFRRYVEHMKRLLRARDVMFSLGDIWPVLMQPFLLTSYYEICRERGKISLPDM